MKKSIVYLFIFISLDIYAQNNKTGIILDEGTKQPVPYATICVMGTKIGTMADNKGYFELNIPDTTLSSNITFTISSLGYHELKISAQDLMQQSSFYIKPKVYDFSEIVVKYKRFKEKELGISKKIVKHSSLSIASSINVIAALFIDNPKKKEGQITEISYFISTKKGFPDAPFRIRVFDFDSKLKKPGEDLLKKSVIVQGGKNGGWFTVNVDTLNIVFPKDGACVGMEWLYDYTDYHYQESNGRTKEVRNFYGQSIGVIKKGTKRITWLRQLGLHDWTILSINPIMINIKVKYYK